MLYLVAKKRPLSASLEVFVFVDELGRDWAAVFAVAAAADGGADIVGDSGNAEGKR